MLVYSDKKLVCVMQRDFSTDYTLGSVHICNLLKLKTSLKSGL